MSEVLETIRLFGPALAGSLLVALACALLGVHVVGRRLVLVGVALPQVAAAGIGLSFLAGTVAWTAPGTPLAFARNHDVMAVLGAVAGAALLMGCPGTRKVPAEVAAGAAYAVAAALSVLFVLPTAQGLEEVRTLVAGDILGIHGDSLADLAAVVVPVLVLLLVLGRRILFTTFDPEMATTLGIRTRLHDGLFFLGLALVVARGVHATGLLFVFSFLLLPAAGAMQVARTPAGIAGGAAAIALVAAASGFLVAASPGLDWPVGPTATVAVFLLFLACRWKGATSSGLPR